MRQTRTGERGAALVAFAISMAAFFALSVVAIDIGRLADTANEVQNVADIAATAGALNLFRGGTAGTARADAQTAAAQNSVAGSAAAIQSADVHVGQYIPATSAFIDGASPPNAVRTTPSTTVQNLFAGYFGGDYLNTTISKRSTAGFTGLGEAKPDLPFVIGSCSFPSIQTCFGSNSCLPTLTFTKYSNNAGWTSYATSPANQNTVNEYFPSVCGVNSSPQPPPDLTVGQSAAVSTINGNVTGLFGDLANCFAPHGPYQYGVTKFIIPIVDACGQFNQNANVLGFATIVIDAVHVGGNGNISLHSVFQDVSGPPGGGAFGTGSVRMFD